MPRLKSSPTSPEAAKRHWQAVEEREEAVYSDFMDGLSLRQIATRHGISRQWVAEIVRRVEQGWCGPEKPQF